MPLKDGSLTRKEQDFLDAYVASGGDVATAERKAGYKPGNGREALAKPQMLALAENMLHAKLLELDGLGLTIVEGLLRDKATPKALQMRAIEFVGKRVDARRDPAGAAEKDVADMSWEELQARAAALEAERAELAKDVTPEGGVFD